MVRQQNASGAATTPASWHASQTPTTHDMRRRTKGMEQNQLSTSFVGIMGRQLVKFRSIQYLVGAVAAAALVFVVPSGAFAQDDQPPAEHHHHVTESSTWTWSTD